MEDSFTPTLTLSTTGDAWGGTLALAVRAVIQDIFSDDEGTPFEARVTTDEGNVLTGMITAADGSYFTLDGTSIAYIDVKHLEVS